MAACALAFAAWAAAVGADERPTPLDSRVEGMDRSQLTTRWWQWAMALPVEPQHDPDGRACALGQQGNVWFLAGTDGTRPVQRRCALPTGLHLLVPVATRYVTRPFVARKGQPPLPDCATLQDRAAMPPEGLLHATVTLDGDALGRVAAHRVSSGGCFDPYPGVPPHAGHPPPLAASDGYWLLLPPLPPGRHVLAVDAHYRLRGEGGFEIVQQFEYVLEVGMAGDQLRI